MQGEKYQQINTPESLSLYNAPLFLFSVKNDSQSVKCFNCSKFGNFSSIPRIYSNLKNKSFITHNLHSTRIFKQMNYVTHHCVSLLSTDGLSYRFIVFLSSRGALRHLSRLFFCTHCALNLTNSINAQTCQITRGFWHVM